MNGFRLSLVWALASACVVEMAQAQPLALPQLNLAAVTQAINADCIGIHVEGPCSCNSNVPDCVMVSYYAPTHMVSVTKDPDHQLLAEDVRAWLLGDEVTLGTPFAFGGSGGVKTQVDGIRTHHFWDVQVDSLPSVLFQASSPAAFATTCLCGTDNAPGVRHYESRTDATWRLDLPSLAGQLLDRQPLGGPLGIWGTLSPLSGFIVHVSAPAAAAAIATRALHAAINPAHGRRLLTPAVPGAEGCIQPGWPTRKPCIRPGTHPAQWEYNALDHTQTALFFFWQERRCCVEPAQLSCAQAAGALHGGPGKDNFCPYPLLPGGFAPGLVPQVDDVTAVPEWPSIPGLGG